MVHFIEKINYKMNLYVLNSYLSFQEIDIGLILDFGICYVV